MSDALFQTRLRDDFSARRTEATHLRTAHFFVKSKGQDNTPSWLESRDEVFDGRPTEMARLIWKNRTHSIPTSPPLSSELPRTHIISLEMGYHVVTFDKRHIIVISRARKIFPLAHGIFVHRYDVYGSRMVQEASSDGLIPVS